MSHELEAFSDGSTGFASARQHAWHRLGTVLPDSFTAAQAHARLGWWNVRKEHLKAVVVTPDGVTTIDVPDRYATVRTNPVTGQLQALGVVGASYVPIQNEEHCDLLDALVDASGAHFETIVRVPANGGWASNIPASLDLSQQFRGVQLPRLDSNQ